MTQELIEHQKVSAIVDNVQAAIADCNQAFDLLIGAKNRLKATLGDSSHGLSSRYYDSLWRDRISDYDLAGEKKTTARQLERNGWSYIIDATGLKQFMTEKRRNEFYKQLESDKVPPLTTENIYNSLMGLSEKVPEMLKEHVNEVFEWLRPQRSELKTNHKTFVGKKVIVWALERWSRYFSINHYRDQNLRSLGTVFSLLDGKGVPQYPNDFYTRFSEWLRRDSTVTGSQYVDEYFKIKIYRNGNIHIEFVRKDLVDRLNQIASDGSLTEGEKKGD